MTNPLSVKEKEYYIYMLKCVNNSYYTGYTTDIDRRYKEHKDGSAKCKYTRSFPPEYIATCWKMTTTLAIALKVEFLIKKLSKPQKEKLIQSPEDLRHHYQATIENQSDINLTVVKF
jgi:putative endonuclease